MQEIIYYTLSFIFNLLLLIITCGITIFFFWKTKVKSKLKGKFDGYFFLMAIFFLFMTIGFAIYFYNMFFYLPSDINTFFEAFFSPNFRILNQIFAKLVILYGLIIVYGIGFLTLAVEHYVYKKTRHVFSILTFSYLIIISPFLIILQYEHFLTTISIDIPIVIAIITLIILMGIYLHLAWNSTGLIRKKSICISLGFFLFFGGIMFNSQIIMNAMGFYGLNRVWIIPLWFIIAILVLFYGAYVKYTEQ